MRMLRFSALTVFLGGIALLAVVIACGGDGDEDPTPTPTERATATTAASKTATSTSTPTEEPTATPTPFDGRVAKLSIPRFKVESAIEDIGLLPNNQLDVPHDPHNTGWYDIYDRPGWGGNAVFSAHVDYFPNIRGPFYDLDQMDMGDDVVITMEDGTEYHYRVTSNTRYDVDTIPMGDIIWPKDQPEDEQWITLITCGGTFQSYSDDGSGPGRYLHRDVVTAVRYL